MYSFHFSAWHRLINLLKRCLALSPKVVGKNTGCWRISSGETGNPENIQMMVKPWPDENVSVCGWWKQPASTRAPLRPYFTWTETERRTFQPSYDKWLVWQGIKQTTDKQPCIIAKALVSSQKRCSSCARNVSVHKGQSGPGPRKNAYRKMLWSISQLPVFLLCVAEFSGFRWEEPQYQQQQHSMM